MGLHEPVGYDCPFCRLLRGKDTPISTPAGIVHQDDHVGVIVNPVSRNGGPGHLMVVPTLHVENLYELPDDVGAYLFPAARRAAAALREVDRCDGIVVRQHNEPAGGQDVWHLHVHVIPSWLNDVSPGGGTRHTTSLAAQHERAASLRTPYREAGQQ